MPSPSWLAPTITARGAAPAAFRSASKSDTAINGTSPGHDQGGRGASLTRRPQTRDDRGVHIAGAWIKYGNRAAALDRQPRLGRVHHRQGAGDNPARLDAHLDHVGKHRQRQLAPLHR